MPPLHPKVLRLRREDPESVSVLAALARAADSGGTLAAHEDAEIASHILTLIDAGLLTLRADESGRLSVQVHDTPEERPPPPSRRERRRKRRKKGSPPPR